MISPDLTKNIKTSLKTAIGQLGYILKKVDEEQHSENVLLQLKAVQSTLSKVTYELLDDTYRKALAEKIALTSHQCPGNCGNEERIQKLMKLFPEIDLHEIPEKLKEAAVLQKELLKYLSDKKLDTPQGEG